MSLWLLWLLYWVAVSFSRYLPEPLATGLVSLGVAVGEVTYRLARRLTGSPG